MTADVNDVATQLGRKIDDPLETEQITAWIELGGDHDLQTLSESRSDHRR